MTPPAHRSHRSRFNPNSEVRNPSSEGNLKPETRKLRLPQLARTHFFYPKTRSDFDLRIFAFLRVSDFRFSPSLTLMLAAWACLWLLTCNAPGQSVFVPAPTLPVGFEPTPSPSADTNQLDAPGPIGHSQTGAAPSSANPFQWRWLTAHPRLNYDVSYGNGIQSSRSNSQNTLIHQIIPGLGLDLGTVWRMDYAPSFVLYSDTNFQSTVNHNGSLTGNTTYEDWRIGFSQTFSLTSDPTIATAEQTDQQAYLTSLDATYQLSGNLALELGFEQNFEFAEGQGLQDSRDWHTLDWLNYQVGPNLGLALGLGGGYLALDGRTSTNTILYFSGTNFGFATNVTANDNNMAYEQIQGRVTFLVSRKIRLSVNGGVEFRQLLNSPTIVYYDGTTPVLTYPPPDGTMINPVFGAALTYRPIEATILSLNANVSTGAAITESALTEIVGFEGSINQRLFRRAYLILSGGYNTTTYLNYTNGDHDRNDDYCFVRVSLSTTFLRHGTASIYYSYSDNESNESGFSYNSGQAGLQIGFGY